MGWLPTLLWQLRLREDRKGHERGGSGQSPPGGRRVTEAGICFSHLRGKGREVLVPHSEWPASLSLWITARNQWDHFSLTTKTERHKPLLVSHLCPQN